MAAMTTTRTRRSTPHVHLPADDARVVGRVYAALAHSPAKSATTIVDRDRVITVTRIGTKRTHGRSRSTSVVVTVGKPNYRWRAFLKQCVAAGEPFPVKKVQLRGRW